MYVKNVSRKNTIYYFISTTEQSEKIGKVKIQCTHFKAKNNTFMYSDV